MNTESPRTPPLPPTDVPQRTPPRAPHRQRKYATIIPVMEVDDSTVEEKEDNEPERETKKRKMM